MALNHWNSVFFQLGELQRQVSNSERSGYVHEVKGDRMRVVMGIKHDGSPLLSPWLSTTDQRGGSRERRMYEKGQNVRINANGGSFRNATVSPWSESTSHPAPAHADQINGDSTQLGKLRVSKNRTGGNMGGSSSSGGSGGGGSSGGGGDQQQGGQHFYDIWIAEDDDNPPEHQDQTGGFQDASGGGGQQQSGQQQQSNSGKAAVKMRVSEKGYFTARIGNDDDALRVAVHKEGVKMRVKNDFAVITKDGKLICSKPWQVEQKDPIPNDND